jgi:NADP-dependent 3-hydroxy acid dehydrogenase YdfG
MQLFKDKTALITGASNGIGRAIALQLAALGARCYLVARRKEQLNETVNLIKQHGGESIAVPADLTVDTDITRLLELVTANGGILDILVHSAGMYASAAMDSADISQFDKIYQANVRGPYFLTQSMLPVLKQAKGQVVFINSSQGLNASGGAGQFAASQHSMKAIADSFRAENNEHGIRVTTLYLGRTATSRMENLYQKQGKQYKPELLIQPEDIASVVSNTLSLPRTAEVTDIHIRPMLKSY